MLPYLIVVRGSVLCFLASCHSVFVCSFAGRELKKECEGVGAGVVGRPGVIQGD